MAKGYAQTTDVDTNLYAGQLPNLAPTPCGQPSYKPKVFCQWNTRFAQRFLLFQIRPLMEQTSTLTPMRSENERSASHSKGEWDNWVKNLRFFNEI
jgi:hypothetical protein